MRTFLAPLLALLATPAQAQGILPPPAEYDRPFDGVVTELRLPLEEVPVTCAGLGGPRYAWACAKLVAPRLCRIILPEYGRVTPNEIEALRRHEIAHCNGWRHE